MSIKLRNFTLIEVLIALAILSMAVVSLTLLVGVATKRTGRAMKHWEQTHLLTQAVEFFMLNEASSTDIDERFFSSDNRSVECVFEEPQGLSENVNSELSGQRLVAMKVILRDKDGKLLDSVTVERIIGGLDK